MDGLVFRQEPPRKLPAMIVAFAGWPDAAEAASGALRYLVEKLGATKFAEIAPEEFYDFTSTRPETRIIRAPPAYIPRSWRPACATACPWRASGATARTT